MDLHRCRRLTKALLFHLLSLRLLQHVAPHFKQGLCNSMLMCFVFYNGSFDCKNQIICIKKCIQILLDSVWQTHRL